MQLREICRYGIAEWFGQQLMNMSPEVRQKYATIRTNKGIQCPFRKDLKHCNKSGGVCTLVNYITDIKGNVKVDTSNPDLITLCPNRFWQDNTIFKEIGKTLIGTNTPTLIKEVNFLKKVDSKGNTQKEYVGKIDLILTNVNEDNKINEWCGLEIQAVYFSGYSMQNEFNAIRENPNELLFPVKVRRPDYRSSGPKRLMPQLEIKIPTLRRWGKKMAVVIDNSFFNSIAPMKKVDSLTNADIAWFIINYDKSNNDLYIQEKVFTTLESSIEGLTAGNPISKENFEEELKGFLSGNKEKLIRLF